MFDPKTLMDRAWAFVNARKPEEACDLFAQAVAEARFLHDPFVLTEALMALGEVERGLKHPATAIDCYREAAAVASQADVPISQAAALIEVAEIQLGQKRTEEATAVCDQLLAVTQRSEDDAALPRARALHLLARIQETSADHEELTLLLQAAAALYEVAGAREPAAACRSHLAFLQGR